jgi:hypothetical protein
MISLSIAPAPETARSPGEDLLNLAAVLKDEKAFKKRLAELEEATAQARADTAAAAAAQKQLQEAKVALADHNAALDASRAAFEAEMAAARKIWLQERSKAEVEIRRRDEESSRLHNQARDHEAKARQAKDNLEARILKVKEAAA